MAKTLQAAKAQAAQKEQLNNELETMLLEQVNIAKEDFNKKGCDFLANQMDKEVTCQFQGLQYNQTKVFTNKKGQKSVMQFVTFVFDKGVRRMPCTYCFIENNDVVRMDFHKADDFITDLCNITKSANADEASGKFVTIKCSYEFNSKTGENELVYKLSK